MVHFPCRCCNWQHRHYNFHHSRYREPQTTNSIQFDIEGMFMVRDILYNYLSCIGYISWGAWGSILRCWEPQYQCRYSSSSDSTHFSSLCKVRKSDQSWCSFDSKYTHCRWVCIRCSNCSNRLHQSHSRITRILNLVGIMPRLCISHYIIWLNLYF